eukprot:3633438-Alexandrium_andersonii.AAC.1
MLCADGSKGPGESWASDGQATKVARRSAVFTRARSHGRDPARELTCGALFPTAPAGEVVGQ